jgi:hypothetical protein
MGWRTKLWHGYEASRLGGLDTGTMYLFANLNSKERMEIEKLLGSLRYCPIKCTSDTLLMCVNNGDEALPIHNSPMSMFDALNIPVLEMLCPEAHSAPHPSRVNALAPRTTLAVNTAPCVIVLFVQGVKAVMWHDVRFELANIQRLECRIEPQPAK